MGVKKVEREMRRNFSFMIEHIYRPSVQESADGNLKVSSVASKRIFVVAKKK